MPLFSPAPRALVAPPTAAPSAPNLSSAATLLGGQASTTGNNQYQLTGIVHAQPAQDSVAILSTAGQAALSVKVGGTLNSAIVLREIHADYVLLDDHGSPKRIALAANNKAALKVSVPDPNQLKSFTP